MLWTEVKGASGDGKHKHLTERIIKAFFSVYNNLGYGFLEKVYENALMIELERESLSALQQARIEVVYEGKIVGEYFADILVEENVIVEIKSTRKLGPEHEAQLLNYLKATNIEVGLLFNFGPEAEIKRKVLDNPRKHPSTSMKCDGGKSQSKIKI